MTEVIAATYREAIGQQAVSFYLIHFDCVQITLWKGTYQIRHTPSPIPKVKLKSEKVVPTPRKIFIFFHFRVADSDVCLMFISMKHGLFPWNTVLQKWRKYAQLNNMRWAYAHSGRRGRVFKSRRLDKAGTPVFKRVSGFFHAHKTPQKGPNFVGLMFVLMFVLARLFFCTAVYMV